MGHGLQNVSSLVSCTSVYDQNWHQHEIVDVVDGNIVVDAAVDVAVNIQFHVDVREDDEEEEKEEEEREKDGGTGMGRRIRLSFHLAPA